MTAIIQISEGKQPLVKQFAQKTWLKLFQKLRGCVSLCFLLPSQVAKARLWSVSARHYFWVFPKMVVPSPQSIHGLTGISMINHPCWGKHPYFWKHPFPGLAISFSDPLTETSFNQNHSGNTPSNGLQTHRLPQMSHVVFFLCCFPKRWAIQYITRYPSDVFFFDRWSC